MIRWSLNDGVTTYTFPLNPKEMGPLGRTYSRQVLAPGATRTQARVLEGREGEAYPWEFSGRIYKQAHYDALELWSRKHMPVTLADHLGRTYKVILTHFDPKDLRRPGTTIRWDYTVKAIVLGRLT
jgi:hypothetical protein